MCKCRYKLRPRYHFDENEAMKNNKFLQLFEKYSHPILRGVSKFFVFLLNKILISFINCLFILIFLFENQHQKKNINFFKSYIGKIFISKSEIFSYFEKNVNFYE